MIKPPIWKPSGANRSPIGFDLTAKNILNTRTASIH